METNSFERNKERAYKALQKAASRIQSWHWHTHPEHRAKHNKKGKLIKSFSPDEDAVELCTASSKLLNGLITPDEAMAMLHTGETAHKLGLARDIGF